MPTKFRGGFPQPRTAEIDTEEVFIGIDQLDVFRGYAEIERCEHTLRIDHEDQGGILLPVTIFPAHGP